MAYRFMSFGESQGAGRSEAYEGLQSAIEGLQRDQSGWILRSGSHRRFLSLG